MRQRGTGSFGKPHLSCSLGLFVALALSCSGTPPAVLHREAEPVPFETYWSHVQPELRPGMTREQRALALAGWVARNGTNDERATGADGVPFLGLCGYRATVFARLGERAGLAVRRVGFTAFAGAGHAAVEVHYDGTWHYLDVTYAGYFRSGDRILSFDEIQARPESALSGLVVLEGQLDRWRDGTPVINAQRMRQNYTPENIRGATRMARLDELRLRRLRAQRQAATRGL